MRFSKHRAARSLVPLIALLSLGVGIAGCEGDDGKDGQDGAAGTPGTPGVTGPVGPTGPTGPVGPAAKIEPRESCGVCHADGSVYGVEEMHAIDREVSFTVVTPPAKDAAIPADLVVTFNIKVNGANYSNFTSLERSVVFNGVAGTYTSYDLRAVDAIDSVSNGNYTLRIAGAGKYVGTDSRYYFRLGSATGITPARRASVYADDAAYVRPSLASNKSCQNCHSTFAEGLTSHHYNPFNVEACVACHSAANPPAIGTVKYELPAMVHGIHNSHEMPGGEYVMDATHKFSVTYPTYMTNCSVCHDTPAALAAANAMPVSGEGCLSCHGSMESWEEGFEETGTTFHLNYTAATNCAECHNSSASAAAPGLVDVRDFHDGLETERVGIIYGGADLSVTQGAPKFNWQISQVVDNKTSGKLEISWTAEFPKGTPVNPCATTVTGKVDSAGVASGAPGFHNASTCPANECGTSFLISFAQGDDYVIGGTSSSGPGQPSSYNVVSAEKATATSPANTVCATTSPYTAVTQITRPTMADGTRAILALQGKPQLLVPAGMSKEHWDFTTMYVRVPTPVYEFTVGTGAKATTPRRAIADTSACLKCHVGSLYQHGNTRVDNVTMCIICHNEASSDQNNRVAMGVDASEAYDGLVGQTYGFKSMLHMLHIAGEGPNDFYAGSKPLSIYRTRGIYAWAYDEAILPNWGTTPACSKTASDGTVTNGNIVYGSDPAVAGGVGCQPFNFYSPTYPMPAYDCYACHKSGFQMIPDQTKAVATTLDAGKAPWGGAAGQLDDVLQGPGAAACTSCHNNSAAKGHAYQNGWTPSTFPNGRQTILDAAK